ncbi:hypothetical protein AB1Y20_008061 [Prymnesium parvum]|uniref:2',3'-cyclic-nucleotide 3'-phosphodiesterase n=1 Tax=Prymnesium parvum TaxID=97485 RepID=A0AB34ISM3_PRYPA|mmetsp:Transcript_36675/g.91350  ORF Transcript_36675/g.91350 Transcript_36675/m.91350 type:complete len:201 (-) Transcript_36675:100-702(-)
MVVYSVWLLPPEEVISVLAGRIARISHSGGLPDFMPHVTLAGGFDLPSEHDAVQRLQRLQGAGAVFCRFPSANVVYGKDPSTGRIPWNQAAITLAEETEALTQLAQRTNEAMIGSSNFHWARPIGKPHLSIAYADNLSCFGRLRFNVSWGSHASQVLRDGFDATTVCLMQTNRRQPDDSLTEYVKEWREIARISLVANQS